MMMAYAARLLLNFTVSNTDGSFSVANSNLLFSPWEILQIIPQ